MNTSSIHKSAENWNVFFIGIWLVLLLNWAAGYVVGQLAFESPRLGSIGFLLWCALPWLCVVIGFFLTSGLMRLLSLLAIPILVYAAMIFSFPILDAIDQIRTNKNPSMEIKNIQNIGVKTNLVHYYYDPGAIGRTSITVRSETKVLPGILWVRNLSINRD